MYKYLKIISFILIPLFITGCGPAGIGSGNAEPTVWIYAFGNLEAILLIIGMSVASFLYETILSPLAFSFIGILMVFKLIKFFFSATKQENAEDNDFFTGAVITKTIFMFLAVTILLIRIPVGIKAIGAKLTPNSGPVETLSGAVGTYSIIPGKKLKLGDNSISAFGKDHFFETESTYQDLLSKSKLTKRILGKNSQGYFSVTLPLAIVFPIELVDKMLYGSDGSNGLLMNLFPDTFPILVADPGKVFKVIAANGPIHRNANETILKDSYTKYTKDEGILIAELNEDTTKVIQSYNNLPYSLYLTLKDKNYDKSYLDILTKDTSDYNQKIVKLFQNNNTTGISDNLYDEPFARLANKTNYSNVYLNNKNQYLKHFSDVPQYELKQIESQSFDGGITKRSDYQINYLLSSNNDKAFLTINGKLTLIGLGNKIKNWNQYKSRKEQTSKDSSIFISPRYDESFSWVGYPIVFNLYNVQNQTAFLPENGKNNLYNMITKEVFTIEKNLSKTEYGTTTPLKLKGLNQNEKIEIFTKNLNKFNRLYNVSNPPTSNSKYFHSNSKMIGKYINLEKQLEKFKNEYIKNLAKDFTDLNIKNKTVPKDTQIGNQRNDLNSFIAPANNEIDKVKSNLSDRFEKNQKQVKEDLTKHIMNKIDNIWSDDVNEIAGEKENRTKVTQESSISIMDLVGKSLAMTIGKIFEVLFTLFLKLIFYVFMLIGSLLYGLLYSFHSLGIILLLITFPIIFISNVILKENYEALYKPFLNYLGYRLWDFSILFVTNLLMLIGPIFLKVFNSESPVIGSLFQLLFLFFIFYITGKSIEIISKIINAESEFNLFGSVSKMAGSTVTAAGGAGLMVAGGGALALSRGAIGTTTMAGKGLAGLDSVKNVGNKIKNTGLGQTVGSIGKSIGEVKDGAINGTKSFMNDGKNGEKVGIGHIGKVAGAALGGSVLGNMSQVKGMMDGATGKSSFSDAIKKTAQTETQRNNNKNGLEGSGETAMQKAKNLTKEFVSGSQHSATEKFNDALGKNPEQSQDSQPKVQNGYGNYGKTNNPVSPQETTENNNTENGSTVNNNGNNNSQNNGNNNNVNKEHPLHKALKASMSDAGETLGKTGSGISDSISPAQAEGISNGTTNIQGGETNLNSSQQQNLNANIAQSLDGQSLQNMQNIENQIQNSIKTALENGNLTGGEMKGQLKDIISQSIQSQGLGDSVNPSQLDNLVNSFNSLGKEGLQNFVTPSS